MLEMCSSCLLLRKGRAGEIGRKLLAEPSSGFSIDVFGVPGVVGTTTFDGRWLWSARAIDGHGDAFGLSGSISTTNDRGVALVRERPAP